MRPRSVSTRCSPASRMWIWGEIAPAIIWPCPRELPPPAAHRRCGGPLSPPPVPSTSGQQAEAAEAGGAEDLGPVDAHAVTDPSQRALGEVAVSVLDGAEDRDQCLRSAAEAADRLVDPRRVDRLVPARRVAHGPGGQARPTIGVGVLPLVVDLRHPV